MPWMKAPEGCSAIGIGGEEFVVGPEGYADIPDVAVLDATAMGFVNADEELNALLEAEETQRLEREAAEKAAAEKKQPAKK
jgi:hypothetical protein